MITGVAEVSKIDIAATLVVSNDPMLVNTALSNCFESIFIRNVIDLPQFKEHKKTYQ